MTARLNIALIEDNVDFQMLLTQILEGSGYAVSAYESVERMLEQRNDDFEFDVFLLDLNLPGEDGLSLSRRLRQASPQVGIVMLTARDAHHDRVKGYDAGADLYLAKPVHIPELLAAMRRFAERFGVATASPQAQTITLDRFTLSGPSGEERLSYDEAIVLSALARAPMGKLATWQFANLLEMDLHDSFKANLAVRMARLRKKLATVGAQDVPIQPLRNFGYQLSVEISLGRREN
jgi:DNA-binding response OmpR family regulator